MSLKSIVEKSFFDHKVNNETRNRLEHNNQIINMFVENPINQNIIWYNFFLFILLNSSSYQLENQSDVKKYDFRNTVKPKKENILNPNKKNVTSSTIMIDNEKIKKKNLLQHENSVFPKINNNENFHNHYNSQQ